MISDSPPDRELEWMTKVYKVQKLNTQNKRYFEQQMNNDVKNKRK